MVINLILSLILWILGALTFAFNAIGLWAPWHYAGFGFVFYLIIPAIAGAISLFSSIKNRNCKNVVINLLIILFNIILTLFTVSVSSTWFW